MYHGIRIPTTTLLSLLLGLALVLPAWAQPRPAPSALPSITVPPEAAAQLSAGAFANGDENWDDRFGEPGVFTWADAVAAAPNGDVYVVGSYISEAGGVPAQYVVRWDGRRFHAIPGIGGYYVHAVAVAANGDVYVTGDFEKAGTKVANGIARWDGKEWHPLGSGLQGDYGRGTGRVLALQGNNVYVGGSFTKAGGKAAHNLAKWDGTTWSAVGEGVGRMNWENKFEPGGDIKAMAVSGNDLYVGGIFQAAGGKIANSIARWDGTTWHPLGSGFSAPFNQAGSVTALAVNGNTVYAAGQFDKAGGVEAANVARWDGTAWHALGEGITGSGSFDVPIQTLLFKDGALYAGGTFKTAGTVTASHFARWDGTAWTEVGGGVDGAVTGLAAGRDGAIYLAGNFDKSGDNTFLQNVGRWDGTRWHALGKGVYGSGSTVNAVAAFGNDVYAGGSFEHMGGVPAKNIARWDGQEWHALGLGTSGSSWGSVYAIAVAPNGDVYVGGSFTQAGGKAANHIAVWSPATQSWSPLGNGTNAQVRAIAIRGNDVYVGGDFTSAGGVTARYVAKWDGTRWSALGGGLNYNVYSVAVADNGHVYVGGDFTQASGFDANGVAVWNGTNWSALGRGVTDGTGRYARDVYDIVVVGNDVYVGGDFVTAGSVAAAGIARWNQVSGWQALASGLGGRQRVNALERNGNLLYVGGNFTTAGDQQVNHLAVWDLAAGTWQALGSGLSPEGDWGSQVTALALHGNDVFVAGEFTAAGGKPASEIARWQGQGAVLTEARIAVDPLTVNFGDVQIGQPEVLLVTLRNEANATGPLTGSVGTPAAPFSVQEGGGAFSLAPGESREVIVRFAPTTAGAATGTLPITHNAVNGASPVNVALRGNGIARDGNRITIRNFNPAGAQVVLSPDNVAPIDTGFVFGTNIYGDKAKSVMFVAPAGKTAQASQIVQVDVYFAYKKPSSAGQTYTLHVYDADPASGRPVGPARYSETYSLASVLADDNPATREVATPHVFAQPVTVNGAFAVAVDFGTYAGAGAVSAAIATNEYVNARVPGVWEQWANGSWHNVSDAWAGSYDANSQPIYGAGQGGWQPWIEVTLQTGGTATSTEPTLDLPGSYALGQNYPNPFNPQTTIRFDLPQSGHVSLKVYDLMGREVATLVDGMVSAGAHEVQFDAQGLASGTYLYQIRAGSFQQSRRMVLVK